MKVQFNKLIHGQIEREKTRKELKAIIKLNKLYYKWYNFHIQMREMGIVTCVFFFVFGPHQSHAYMSQLGVQQYVEIWGLI